MGKRHYYFFCQGKTDFFFVSPCLWPGGTCSTPVNSCRSDVPRGRSSFMQNKTSHDGCHLLHSLRTYWWLSWWMYGPCNSGTATFASFSIKLLEIPTFLCCFLLIQLSSLGDHTEHIQTQKDCYTIQKKSDFSQCGLHICMKKLVSIILDYIDS